jgi:hypothetical protein
VILEVAIEERAKQLTVGGLWRKIVADPEDSKEVEIATQAIDDLERSDLLRYLNDEVVKLTPAAVRAHELLIGNL